MKKVLFGISLILLASSLAWGNPGNVDTTGLMAYYPFSGNAGDSSGQGNNGTVYGATLTADRFGNPNSAYDFNGTSDYIRVPYSPGLNPTSSITVSVWIKADAWGGLSYSSYIVQTEQNEGRGYVLRGGNAMLEFVFLAGGTGHESEMPVGSVGTGTWYHVTGVFDGAVSKIYLDGVLKGSTTYNGTMTPSTGDLYIGTSYNLFRYFDGTIDDIRIYNRALSQAEIDSLSGNTSLATPILIAPDDSASLSTPHFPLFVWQKGDSAEYYRFQLSTNSTFASGSLVEDYTTLDTSAMPISMPAGSGQYWWRVTACRGLFSKTSEARLFWIGIPGLISPARDTVFDSSNKPTFLWHSADSATYYQLWVAKDDGFSNIVINHTLYDTSYSPAGPLTDSHYYWKVKAYGISSLGPFQSETRHFGINLYGGVVGQPWSSVPSRFQMDPPYPNPARTAATIRWELPELADVRLDVYNVAGQCLTTLFNAKQPSGKHQLGWNLKDDKGRRVANGVYFLRLTAGASSTGTKITVIR